MWILLTLSLAASEGAFSATPALQPSQTEPWFRQRSKAFGSSVRMAPAARPSGILRSQAAAATPADPSAMTCTIRVLRADPDFDTKIARPAPPDLDPKIVRPSLCRK